MRLAKGGVGVRRVVISGPESTGKTTLARRLAERYRTAWVPEYVRTYLESRPPRDPPSLVLWDDVEELARGQLQAEEDAALAAHGVLFCDTDLHSTKLYCEHYFGRCPDWIARAARERSYDLHLLLGTDVPWVGDPLRDPSQGREQMLALFRRELQAAQRRTVELQGGFDARFAAAVRAVDALLAESAP
jgi:NadR type nicotinamide-nucleotide adenylyltransferase